MSFKPSDVQTLIELLRRDPTVRSELRQLLVPEESVEGRLDSVDRRLAELTQRLAELADAQRQTEQRLAELAEAQRRTEASLERLTGRVGDLFGWRLEWRYRERTAAYFGRLLREPRIVDPGEILDEIETRLSADELDDFLEADLLVAGALRDRPEAGEIWVVLEISSVVDASDVKRAERRAALLARTGRTVVPAVAGERLVPEASDALEAGGLAWFEDGRSNRWQEATARALGEA